MQSILHLLFTDFLSAMILFTFSLEINIKLYKNSMNLKMNIQLNSLKKREKEKAKNMKHVSIRCLFG
jgi:hypothetical protein